jgi:type II secretory pathway component PulM
MLKFKIDKQKKYILLAVGILLLFGIIYRFFPFFQGIQEAGAEIVLKERQLAKYRQMVQEGDDLQAKINFLTRTLKQVEFGLLTGETPALAAVNVQNTLNEVASKSELEIKRVRVLKPEKMDGENYLIVPVQFTISSTIGQLKEILYRIESSPKYLTIKKIRISVRHGRHRTDLGQIQSDLTVAGVMKLPEN